MKSDFETKDSGKRQVFATGMQRDTSEGKERPDLVRDGPMLRRWIGLMTRGAQKYDARNWMKASTEEELERAYISADRHDEQWRRGETDEDHAAAMYFNINLAEYIKEKLAEPKRLKVVKQHRTKHKTDARPWSALHNDGWHDYDEQCESFMRLDFTKEKFDNEFRMAYSE